MPGTNGGPNMTRRIIDIGVSGSPTNIVATGPCRGWIISESLITSAGVANTRQGWITRIPNDGTANGFTTKFTRAAASASDPVPFFENINRISEVGPNGEVFAGPGGAMGAGGGTTSATKLCDAQSLTATATSIEIVEYF